MFIYCDNKKYFSKDLEKENIFSFRVYENGKIGNIPFILSKSGIKKIIK